MKCPNCGADIKHDTAICQYCGTSTGYRPEKQEKSYNVNVSIPSSEKESTNKTLKTIALLLMVLSLASTAITIIPLFWMLPMIIYYSSRIKQNKDVSLAFKILTLVLVNAIAGIIMLCIKDPKKDNAN